MNCKLCDQPFGHLNNARRSMHESRCLDNLILSILSKHSNRYKECVFCQQTWSGELRLSLSKRIKHLKECGQAQGLSGRDILEFIKSKDPPDESVSSVVCMNELDNDFSTIRPVLRVKTMNKPEKEWKHDEELQIALAMSCSTAPPGHKFKKLSDSPKQQFKYSTVSCPRKKKKAQDMQVLFGDELQSCLKSRSQALMDRYLVKKTFKEENRKENESSLWELSKLEGELKSNQFFNGVLPKSPTRSPEESFQDALESIEQDMLPVEKNAVRKEDFFKEAQVEMSNVEKPVEERSMIEENLAELPKEESIIQIVDESPFLEMHSFHQDLNDIQVISQNDNPSTGQEDSQGLEKRIQDMKEQYYLKRKELELELEQEMERIKKRYEERLNALQKEEEEALQKISESTRKSPTVVPPSPVSPKRLSLRQALEQYEELTSNIEHALYHYIKSSSFYEQILRYEPLDVDQVHQAMDAEDFKCTKKVLMQFLDQKGIAYTQSLPSKKSRKKS